MAQTIYPDATVDAGTWTPQGEATLHQALNANDFSYAQSVLDPNTEAFEVSLESPLLPVPDTGHVIKLRGSKTVAGTPSSATGSLYQGGTLIYGTSVTITSSLTTHSIPISESLAANITDYTDLRLRVSGNGAGGGNRITFPSVWLELPDRVYTPVSVGGTLSFSGLVTLVKFLTDSKFRRAWLTRRHRGEL